MVDARFQVLSRWKAALPPKTTRVKKFNIMILTGKTWQFFWYCQRKKLENTTNRTLPQTKYPLL
jgi:hypothetical protein